MAQHGCWTVPCFKGKGAPLPDVHLAELQCMAHCNAVGQVGARSERIHTSRLKRCRAALQLSLSCHSPTSVPHASDPFFCILSAPCRHLTASQGRESVGCVHKHRCRCGAALCTVRFLQCRALWGPAYAVRRASNRACRAAVLPLAVLAVLAVLPLDKLGNKLVSLGLRA